MTAAKTLTSRRLAAALKAVPERRFLITELAPRLLDAGGKVDVEKCLELQTEISLAAREVGDYAGRVKEIRESLESMKTGQAGGPDDDDFDEDYIVGEEDGL